MYRERRRQLQGAEHVIKLVGATSSDVITTNRSTEHGAATADVTRRRLMDSTCRLTSLSVIIYERRGLADLRVDRSPASLGSVSRTRRPYTSFRAAAISLSLYIERRS